MECNKNSYTNQIKRAELYHPLLKEYTSYNVYYSENTDLYNYTSLPTLECKNNLHYTVYNLRIKILSYMIKNIQNSDCNIN